MVAGTLELAKNVFQRYAHEKATIAKIMQLHILCNKIALCSELFVFIVLPHLIYLN
jgi:hypothetical protein